MTEQHPITPPPELVQQWVQATESNDCIGAFPTNFEKRICTAAARWGGDQELEAIQKEIITQAWFADPGHRLAQLRAARRPKPPSLKERLSKAIAEGDERQALKLLEELDDSL